MGQGGISVRLRFSVPACFALLSLLSSLFVPSSVAAAENVACLRAGDALTFRVELPLADLTGVPAERCVATGASPNVAFLFALDSRRADEGAERGWRGGRRTAEEEALEKELEEVRERNPTLWRDRYEQERELEFLDHLLARADSGEVRLPAEEREALGAKRAELARNRDELRKFEEENDRAREALHKRLADLPRERASREVSLVVAGRARADGPVSFRIIDRADGRMLRVISFDPPADEGGDPSARAAYGRMAERMFAEYAAASPGDSLFDYLRAHEKNRLEGAFAAPPRAREERPRPDIHSLATGALAVAEALQLDRMTGPVARGGKTVDIATLTGPQIRSHDYDAMRGGTVPATWPVERAVPEECWYFRFASIERQFAFTDLADRWGTSLLSAFRVNGGDARLKERLLARLCLESGALTRLFGERAIGDVSLVGTDPLLEEGSALAVILRVKERALFAASRAARIEAARRARPDLAEREITIRGRKVAAVTTGDRTIHAFTADIDEEFTVVADSPALLERILAARDGEAKCLAEVPDFRYLRTIFRAREGEEEGFLYLSDAFIRTMVGPAWKIARARRLECTASLATLDHAVTLWRAEGGAGAPTLESLLASGALHASYLHCPDGGRYAFDPATAVPCCSFHGHRGSLAPLLERTVTRISKAEAEAYEGFVREYNTYWTTFFDPVAVRVRMRDGRTLCETCILPLVDNSAYQGLKRFSGGMPVDMAHPRVAGVIAEVLLKLDLERRLEEFGVTRMIAETPFTVAEIRALVGGSVGFHLVDAPLRFTFETGDAPLARMAMDQGMQALSIGFLLASLAVPVYATVPVTDEATAERLVERLCAEAVSSARAAGGGFFRTGAESYRIESGDGAPVRTLALTLFLVKVRLHFTVRDGFLAVSTDRAVALDLARGRAERHPAHGNLVFRVFFDAFRAAGEELRLDWAERMRAACAANLAPLAALARWRKVAEADLDAAALATRGQAPLCPAGGTYRYDASCEVALCTVHGDAEDPRQPLSPDPAQPLQAFLNGLRSFSASLEMTPEGIMTRLELVEGK